MTSPELTITEMSRLSGFSAHTLRYYERIGLIGGPHRNGGGHRRYRQADIDWVSFLKRLRDMGMPIRDMKRYAELRANGPATVTARRELLEAYRSAIAAHIADLQANMAVLDDKIALYREMDAGRFPNGDHHQ